MSGKETLKFELSVEDVGVLREACLYLSYYKNIVPERAKKAERMYSQLTNLQTDWLEYKFEQELEEKE